MVGGGGAAYRRGKPLVSEALQGITMTTETTTSAGLATVQSFFAAVAAKDMAAVRGVLAPEVTWNHRNEDRFAHVLSGPDAILAYIGESVQLTQGTLRPQPVLMLTDGAGNIAVRVQLTASRPDGRVLDDPQMVLFTVDDGRITRVDQFVGDAKAVTAFWA